MSDLVSAIIPASGFGNRFGGSKIRAQYDGKLFLDNILEVLIKSGINEYKIIINSDDFEFCKNCINEKDIVINKNPNLEMIYSIYLGIMSSVESAGYLIFPIDHPFVNSSTVDKLLLTFSSNRNSVVKPSFERKSGHPLIIPKILVNEINLKYQKYSLNEIIKESNLKTLFVDVDDENILRNINNQNDLINVVE